VFEDELEVGFDERFETRWRRTELLSHLVMLAVVLVALAGLFGRGPASHRTVISPDGSLTVDYEPICRYGTTTQVTIHLDTRMLAGRPVAALTVSPPFAEPMGLQQILPEPLDGASGITGTTYRFAAKLSDPQVMLRFVLKPNTAGPVTLRARYAHADVAWTQWVMP
jgi:hypothetical protein